MNEKIHNILEEMQILESNILQKSETINTVTTFMDSYHNGISSHINEVLFIFFSHFYTIYVIRFISYYLICKLNTNVQFEFIITITLIHYYLIQI